MVLERKPQKQQQVALEAKLQNRKNEKHFLVMKILRQKN